MMMMLGESIFGHKTLETEVGYHDDRHHHNHDDHYNR